MALSKKTVIESVNVLLDGRIVVLEIEEVWDGGFKKGAVIATGTRRRRWINPGDDVSTEDQLIQDIVNGNLHTAERKALLDQEGS